MTVTPRAASTLVLLQHDGSEPPKVLMVVRNEKTVFAGGALVFPGGSVDQGDHALAADIAGDYPALTLEDLALRVAAIRETFEESGILLARGADGTPVSAAVVSGLLDSCRTSEGPDFRAALSAGGLVPAVDSLVPFARWITPPIRPKRFDTHFFVATAPAGQALAHDGSEAVDSIWIEPQEAIDGSVDGRFKLVFATRMNLARIAASGSAGQVIALAQATPVVTIVPEYVDTPDGKSIRIPIEAGYGGDLFPAIDQPSM